MKQQADAGRMISIVSNQIKRQFDADSLSGDPTSVQGRLLHFILSHPQEQELFQKDIEEQFNLRRSTATGILQLMEKNGLLRRESVPYDARLKRLIVTEKGRGMKEHVEESIHAMEKKLQQNISADDLETFFRVIKQMSQNLE